MMVNSNDDKLKKNERTLDPNCVILHYYIVIFRLLDCFKGKYLINCIILMIDLQLIFPLSLKFCSYMSSFFFVYISILLQAVDVFNSF